MLGTTLYICAAFYPTEGHWDTLVLIKTRKSGKNHFAIDSVLIKTRKNEKIIFAPFLNFILHDSIYVLSLFWNQFHVLDSFKNQSGFR